LGEFTTEVPGGEAVASLRAQKAVLRLGQERKGEERRGDKSGLAGLKRCYMSQSSIEVRQAKVQVQERRDASAVVRIEDHKSKERRL
jgi:hypothetical protein